jgi:hypothetical protein
LRKRKVLLNSSIAGRRGRSKRTIARRILAGNTGGLPTADAANYQGTTPSYT